MKRKLLTFYTIIFALISALALCVGCSKKDDTPQTDGSEIGEYYCESDAGEYLITLSEGYEFTFAIDAVTTGRYKLVGTSLTFVFADEAEDLSALLEGNTLTVIYNGVTYRFLKKIEYTVKFVTNGGSAIADAKVINGKTVSRPAQDPVKDNYVFVGWYADSNFTTAYSFATPVTGELSLYARYVEALRNPVEYTVKFAGEGAEGIAERTTLRGVVYNLPTPERDGYEFVGWWVSDFDSAEKLTYQYKEQVLAENTTLFAVWADGAPAVSVENNTISWSAVGGVNSSYRVTVTPPNGAAETRNVSTTSLTYDFASKPEGEYAIQVEVNGKATTVYYNNKALARVSVFTVEDSVLQFNKVANAVQYVLTVACGSASHDHGEIELTNNTYDFSACDMQKEGITFTVTAKADGYVSSVSAPFVFERTLDEVSGLTVDPSTQVASWNAVDSATAYDVAVTLNGETVYGNANFNELSLPLKQYGKGEIKVTVTPKAHGWNAPEAAELTYDKTTVATPSNLRLIGHTVEWDAVANATAYELTVNGTTVTVEGTSYTLTDLNDASCTIYVRAIAEKAAESSVLSDAFVITGGSMSELKYAAGVVSWESVFGATSYDVRINGGASVNIQAASCEVTFTQSGENTVSVRANTADGSTPWIEITVVAFEISFDAQGGDEVSPVYKAKGDPITLPTASRYGYNLQGWYTAAGGELGGGKQYTDGSFNGDADLTLYAAWDSEKYNITLDVGAHSGDVLEPATVGYHEPYSLPVPASNSDEWAFIGWFTEGGTAGTQRTDFEGNSVDNFNYSSNITLYAHWVELFTFTKINSGYSVSKNGTNLRYVKEIKIPYVHFGEPVTTVEDFSNSPTIEVVRIPDSIQVISLGTEGLAFKGCTALRSVEIYEVTDATFEKPDQVYWSEGGVLIQNVDNVKQLRYFPIGNTGDENGVYTVPEGVTLLPGGVFNGTKLVEIRIPASVTMLETAAIKSNSSLTAITFLEGDGENSNPLSIHDKAIDSNGNLTTLTLPARLEGFSSISVNACDALSNVYVVGDDGDFSDIDGVLCRTTTVDGVSGIEIVYFPLAKGGAYTIPDDVSFIGASAFAGNKALTAVTIPGTVRYIGKEAFKGCTGILTLTFSGGDKDLALTIAESAFYGCSKIEEVTLPGNLVKLGAYAFGGASKLVTVYVMSGGAGVDLDFAERAFGTTATNSVFYVTEVHLGANVPLLEISAIFGNKINAVIVDGGNLYYSSGEDGVLYNTDKTMIAYYPSAREGRYEIPSTVTSISANLFQSRTLLTEVYIPNSITEIGAQAFMGCSGLTKVEFQAGDQDLVIDDSAFYQCTLLQTIELPARTKRLGNSVFAFAGLTSLHIPANVESIGDRTADVFMLFNYKSSTDANPSYGTYYLEEITVDSANNYYAAIEGVLYMKSYDKTTDTYYISDLLYNPMSNKNSVIHVPGTVRVVHAQAFHPSPYTTTAGVREVIFEKLEAVGDGAAALEIQKGAFASTALESISLPEGLTSIGEGTFSSCYSLQEIVIPSTVTYIGIDAFSYCKALETVTFTGGGTEALVIADGVKTQSLHSITYTSVFNSCYALTTITFPERTKRIGSFAFVQCPGLETVNLPASLEEIGEEAFSVTAVYGIIYTVPMVSSIKTVTITDTEENPSQLRIIEKNAFGYANALTSINLPSSLEEIGYGAFINAGLISIELPASVTKIGDYAFQGVHLKTITFHEGLEEIGNSAFAYNDFTEITLPASLTTMGTNAFSYNYNLQTVTFADGIQLEVLNNWTFAYCYALEEVNFGKNCGITQIGDGSSSVAFVFAYCTSLKTLTIPASVTLISSGFAKYSGIEQITFEPESKLKEIKAEAFIATALTSFAFPEVEDALTIGTSLFKSCTQLTEVTLSKSVESITDVFTGCGSIKKIIVASNNEYFSADPDYPILYNKAGTVIRLIYADYSDNEGVFTIKDGTTEIDSNAFRGQRGVVRVVIPQSVQNIGNYAFDGCINLTAVEIAPNCELTSIGDYAFRDCWNLDSIQIENATNLSSIGAYAFEYCFALKELDLAKNTNLTTIGNYAFYDMYRLTSIKLPNSLQTVGTYAFAYTGFTSIELPASLTSIGNYAFSYAKITSIALPASSVTLGTYLFQYSALQSADLSQWGGTALPNNMFFHCASLTSVQWPANLSTFGNYVFAYCTALTEITLPTSTTKLGTYLFQNSGLQSIDLSNLTVTALGNYDFDGCASLASVTLPSSINFLGTYTFRNSGLREIDLSGTKLTMIGKSATAAAYNDAAYTFQNCASLTKVVLPANLTKIAAYVFDGCSSLSDVNFADATQLTLLGNYSFQNTGFRELTLPKSVIGTSASAAFGNYAFANSKQLTKVTFPKEVLFIGQHMFENCTLLSEVVFAEDSELKTASTYAFAGCTALKTFSFPDKLAATTLGTYFFAGSGLMSIDLSNTKKLTSLGNYSFSECANLTSVTLPATLKHLGTYTFQNCTALEEIDLSKLTNMTVIGSSATACKIDTASYVFAGCTNLQKVTLPESVTKIGAYVFKDCASLASIDLSHLTLIGNGAFYHTGLTSVTLPADLTDFGIGVFGNCTALNAIVANGDAFSTDDNGILYAADGTLLWVPANITGDDEGTLTLKENAIIGSYAFAGVNGVNTIVIPAGATIKDYAFSGCGIQNVIVSGAVSIGNYAFADGSFVNVDISAVAPEVLDGTTYLFSGNSDLASVALPEGLEKIGDYWFYNDEALTDFTISETVSQIGAYAFSGSGIKNVVIPEAMVKIGDSAFSASKMETLVVKSVNLDLTAVTSGVTYKPQLLFANTEYLKTVTFAEGTQAIGGTSSNNKWFFNTPVLESVTIPDSVTTIGSNMFQDSGIKNIKLPEGLTRLEGSLFNGSKLESIYIPSAVAATGASVFANCTSLTKVEFAEDCQVSQLSNALFSGCTALTWINIPASVSITISSVFANCTSLNIYLPATAMADMRETFATWTGNQTIYFESSEFELLSSVGASFFRSLKAQCVFGAKFEDVYTD